ncbi:MAG: alpha/beta hydrolase [Faecalibacterium sp.]|jgi:alpha-beta hydrolase superfamily lysophospholipase|nr:alpha/beta hydrolase [Faecalibacterium sp.]
MTTTNFTINSIPAVLYGENADKVCLYIHGKCGYKEEAQSLAEILCPRGFQVLSIDLPEHGERKNGEAKLVPWVAVPELQGVLAYAKQRWHSISLHATSIGAYFSLLAFSEEAFEKVMFVSPVVDMKKLIETMMQWAQVSAERLQAEKEIPTQFGETLSWEYYTYAKEHSLTHWNSKTAILYAGHDNLTDRDTITEFAEQFGCELQIYEDGEHWFHTEEQLAVWRNWIEHSQKACATENKNPARS